MTRVTKLTNFNAVTNAAASGDAALIAAAAAMPVFRRDRVLPAAGALADYDLKSIYVDDGVGLAPGKTFNNLVDGAAAASILLAGNMARVQNGGRNVGLRMIGNGNVIRMPDTCRFAANAQRFVAIVWVQVNAAFTVSATRSFMGHAYQIGQAQYLIGASGMGSLYTLVDGDFREMTGFAVGSVMQIAVEFQAGGVASHHRQFLNGAQIADFTRDDGGGLTQVTEAVQNYAQVPIIGRITGLDNSDLDATFYRAIVEDLSVSGRTAAQVVAADWAAYSARF